MKGEISAVDGGDNYVFVIGSDLAQGPLFASHCCDGCILIWGWFPVQCRQHQQRRGGDEDYGEQRQWEQQPRQNGHRCLHLHRAEQLGQQVQTLWAEVPSGVGAEGSMCVFNISISRVLCFMSIGGLNCEMPGGKVFHEDMFFDTNKHSAWLFFLNIQHQ